MKKQLSKISNQHELIIVVVVVFGWLIFQSNHEFFSPKNSEGGFYFYDNSSYIILLVYELVIMCLMLFFLQTRNWHLKDFPTQVTWKAIGAGFLMFFLRNILLNLSIEMPFFNELINERTPEFVYNDVNISVPLVILTGAIVNPFFEEIFLIGYLGKWFQRYSPFVFILTSTLLRMSYHTYQGFYGVYSIAILGIMFTLYYQKYRNLTPIIITHMLINLTYYLDTFYFE